MSIGADLVVRTVKAIHEGTNPETPQRSIVHGELKDAPKLFKETCRIDWNRSALEIHNLIRGLSPFPTAYTELFGSEPIALKIFRSKVCTDRFGLQKPGTLRTEKRQLFVCCSDGWLELLEVQLAGKKRMSASDLLLGFSIEGLRAE
jgi:methionyl-tRNA formyltransferase